jgi:hypothetical protein
MRSRRVRSEVLRPALRHVPRPSTWHAARPSTAVRIATVLGLLLVVGAFPAASVSQAAATTCEKQVQFGLVDARTDGCLNTTPGSSHWVTTDLVTLNGVPLPLAAGSQLTLDGPSTAAPGGRIALSTAPITIGGFVTLEPQSIDAKLPVGGPGGEADFLALRPNPGQTLRGFGITGAVSLRLGKDASGAGYSKVVMILKLPSIFKNGPGEAAGGLTGTVAVRVDPGIPPNLDGLKFEIGSAYFGQLEIRNLCLSDTPPGSLVSPCSPPPFGATSLFTCRSAAPWNGTTEVVLPTASHPAIGVFAGTDGSQLDYAGAQLTGLGDNLPLATGVFLDSFGAAVCLDPRHPLKVTGGAGLHFGPLVAKKEAASLDGTLTYEDSRPWTVEALGKLSLFDRPFANGYLKYQSSGSIDFGFGANVNFGPLKVTGNLKGWYQAPSRRFDVFGSGEICLSSACTNGQLAVSSVGVAGCATILSFEYPEPYWFGVRWKRVTVRAGGGYRWATRTLDVMGDSCGVGRFRATKAALIPGDETSFEIPKDSPATLVTLTGLGAPPLVTLTSPTGEKIVLDGSGEYKAGKYLAATDPGDNTSQITLGEPAPGKWKVHVDCCSIPLASVGLTDVHPAATAAGHVVEVGGGLRELKYIYERQPNQSIEFVERGEKYERVLGTAGGEACADLHVPAPPSPGDLPASPTLTCGTILFNPAPGPGGARRILGVVSDHGLQTSEVNVADYDAPAVARLAAPASVHIERTDTQRVANFPGTSSVTISWSPVAKAKTYAVAIALSDGERIVEAVPASEARVVLRSRVELGDAITATVSGISSDQTEGLSHVATSAGAPGGEGPIPGLPVLG